MFRKTALLTIALLFLAACKGDTEGQDNAEPNNTSANVGNSGGLQVLPSQSPRVKFKGGERWARQLSRALDLEEDALCKEFGAYDCAGEVHFIALGGVEPYKLGVREPLPTAPLTAPIAVERIALSACAERAERDLENPDDAVLFPEISDEPSAEDFNAMGSRLYRRILSRDAEPGELEELAGFWDELEGDDRPVEWATLTCFAVASSTESLFY